MGKDGYLYGDLNKKKKEYYNKSQNDVNIIINALIKAKGGSKEDFYLATSEEDMFMHVDLWWLYKGKKIGIDVKGLKKSKQSDKEYDDTIQWVELRGVSNYKGWLFGDETYVMFVTTKSVIVIRLEHLQQCVKDFLQDDILFNLCKENKYIPFTDAEFIKKHDIKNNNERMYKPHTRFFKGMPRHDISMKIYTDDIRKYMEEEIFL